MVEVHCWRSELVWVTSKAMNPRSPKSYPENAKDESQSEQQRLGLVLEKTSNGGDRVRVKSVIPHPGFRPSLTPRIRYVRVLGVVVMVSKAAGCINFFMAYNDEYSDEYFSKLSPPHRCCPNRWHHRLSRLATFLSGLTAGHALNCPFQRPLRSSRCLLHTPQVHSHAHQLPCSPKPAIP